MVTKSKSVKKAGAVGAAGAGRVAGVTGGKKVGKWKLVLALGLFCGVSVTVVLINTLFCGYGWHTEWSISRYVGKETWSAIVFALCNLVVAGLLAVYLCDFAKAWKMPKVFYAVATALVVALVMLSIFPYGYFDAEGHKNIITLVHEVSSRTMFLMMLILTALVVSRRGTTTATKVVGFGYLYFGAMSTVMYTIHAKWYWGLLIEMESLFIIGFMVVLMVAKKKGEQKKIGKVR